MSPDGDRVINIGPLLIIPLLVLTLCSQKKCIEREKHKGRSPKFSESHHSPLDLRYSENPSALHIYIIFLSHDIFCPKIDRGGWTELNQNKK